MISVRVYADEVIFRLDTLPKRVREVLKAKYDNIFAQLVSDMADRTPTKYIDPKTIQTGVDMLGSSVIGFIEAEQKPGVYSIFPSKARVLRFIAKSGELVFTTAVTRHPFMSPQPSIENFLRLKKPWVEEQLSDALKDL